MKKHLIAAAVAGAFAVPAMAQVTVSGTLDLGVGTEEVSLGTATVKRTNTGVGSRLSTSQIVFSAQEDLGGGLRVQALHSMQIGTSNTTDADLVPRDSFIRLSGGFGDLRLGRFTPAFETNAALYSVTGTTNSAGTADFIFGTGAQAAPSNATLTTAGTAGPAVRYEDVGRGLGSSGTTGPSATNAGQTIQYSLPAFGPVVVTVGYTRQSAEVTGAINGDQISQMDLVLNYSAGPLGFGIAMVDRDNEINGVAGTAKVKMQSAGLSYNAGVAVAKLGYITREQKTAAGVKNVDANVISAGVSVPFGATTLHANYLTGEDDADGAANARDFSGYQVGALYAMSKRTTAYVVVGMNEFKGNTVARTSDRETATIGLRHNF